MNLKHLSFAAIILAVVNSSTLFAQETATAPTAQKVDDVAAQIAVEAKAEVAAAKQTAETQTQAIESKLQDEIQATTAATPTPPPEDPLIDQYRLRKDKNFKSIEFELAKELALHRSSKDLATQEDALYTAALANLSTALGNISEPQKEETYFEYQEDPETGEFVVVLVKDSYVKAERGDLCQIGTQVHLKTSIQEQFTAKLADIAPASPTTPANQADATTAVAPATTPAVSQGPTTVTEIECYNEERPTYSQRLVN